MNTRNHLAAPLLALSLAAATAAWAQTIGKPPEQLGKVSFANSCAPAVRATFERAVALMHSFWFQESERTFREVLKRDPSCAIATWGIATMLMGNPTGAGSSPQNVQRAQEAIEHGRAIGAKTERERFYIEAIAEYYDRFGDRPQSARIKSLADAFAVVAKRFPDDDEAQTFYAIYLIASQQKTDKTLAATLKAAEILETQFAKHPEHPGVAHYLIHSYDYPSIAEKGLKAAKRYAEIAPSVAHGQHMPSHIFNQLGMWQESVAANRRAAAVARTGKDPDQELHAMEYMTYAYMQLARDRNANLLVEEAQRVTGADRHRASAALALATIPARYAVERGMWKDAARLELHPSKILYADAMTYFARALGAARSGDTAAAGKDVQELGRIVEVLKAAKNDYWAAEVEVQRLGAAAWTAYATGNRDEALALMRAAAAMEDKSEALGPGRIVPARELLGEMLLESGRAGEALPEFERSQGHDPNRFRSLYGAGRAAAQSGTRDKARYYFSRLIDMAGSGDLRPEMDRARQYLASSWIGVGATETQTAYAQQANDPRVADLVRTGKLRVGLGLGSPSGAVKNPATGELHGPALDLGRALAARIGVDFVAVEYPRPGAVLEGAQTNAWDVAFLVIDPERAKQGDFAPPHTQTDFTYLVPAGSSIYKVADADQPGIRIAVPRGDGVDLNLTRLLKKAELVRTDTLPAAVELLRTGGAHARAGPRPVLLAESVKLPGSRVLADGFAVSSSAALVPKGHAGRLAYVSEFIEEAKASGLVKKIIEDAGLRGVQVAPARKPSPQ